MAAFADLEDVATYLAVDESTLDADQVELLLDIASNAIRDEAGGQVIEQVTDDQIELRGVWAPDLWLPQFPVTAVDSIAVDGNELAATSYRFSSDGRVTRYPGAGINEAPLDGPDGTGPCHWGGPDLLVAVTYTHGYEEIPPSVKGICLDLVKRAIRTPDAGAIIQETVASYSVSYSREAASTLTKGERRRLRAYKRKNRSVTLTR